MLAACLLILTACEDVEEVVNNSTEPAAPTTSATTTTPDSTTPPVTTEPDVTENEEVFSENIKFSLTLDSPNAAVLDLNTNEIIFEKGIDERISPASTTKLLTAITALKYCDEETVFTAGSELSLVSPNSSLAFINTGNQLTVSQLITAMMIASGNDAAYILAANVGRLVSMDYELPASMAVDYFCSLMNETAKELGAESSNFTTPDGYYDENHYTTVRDMLIIAAEATKHEAITEAAAKPEVTVTYVSGQIAKWSNSNALVNQYNNVYMPECTGLKTGFCDEAGYCLIASAQNGGRSVITAIFGAAESSIRWEESRELLYKGLYT